jgi:hypothetical protein
MEKAPSGSEQKINEYVARIRGGESKESILQGLPPSFINGIESGLAAPKAAFDEDIRKQKQIDAAKLAEAREELNKVPGEHALTSFNSVPDIVEYISKGRNQVVQDLYHNLLSNIDDHRSRKALASGLFQDVYNKYRVAEYPTDQQEEQTWEAALKSKDVPVNNKKTEWMYRGIFPKTGEGTVARGSLNVRVTPELIRTLDGLIVGGRIKANYKFGQPGTPASPNERHDSISIYFLERPDAAALEQLSLAIKPYVRGDNLLGRKISDGFYISEIGSIESDHVNTLVESFKEKDPAFAEALKSYTSPRPGQGDSLQMSEAQFYAIKNVSQAFGYHLSYDKDTGFIIL